jgi:hypothetical protein
VVCSEEIQEEAYMGVEGKNPKFFPDSIQTPTLIGGQAISARTSPLEPKGYPIR